eukprot:CAMPEP_0119014096 /NCGR_PEP_ID=MMETSP1176-20130426/9350_1 /TAXON_ID=265551 /ORGANISM="Synedropsis recta cf, Strain CCMP1620" /LENGTH=296 /DNA_ID=CAMNT_0006967235 /DNA_START=30 /DNA_END=920 /DNA_ORIENTATION=+
MTPATESTMETPFGEPDVYGQRHPIESLELIETRLKELEKELESLVAASKETAKTNGWVQAKERCAPELIDNDFKLLFLRARKFHPKSAAKRIVDYWNHRIDIFEDERAFLPLTLVGALREDKVALEIGMAQLTNTQDATGRTIFFFDPSKQDKSLYSRKSMGRAFWYVIHAALELESAQQKGVVFVTYGKNTQLSQFDRSLIGIIAPSIRGSLPIRLAAMHVCYPPLFFNIIFSVISIFLGDKLRKRVRMHGGGTKLPSKLAELGLTADLLPTELDGDIMLDVNKWLEKRRTAGK